MYPQRVEQSVLQAPLCWKVQQQSPQLLKNKVNALKLMSTAAVVLTVMSVILVTCGLFSSTAILRTHYYDSSNSESPLREMLMTTPNNQTKTSSTSTADQANTDSSATLTESWIIRWGRWQLCISRSNVLSHHRTHNPFNQRVSRKPCQHCISENSKFNHRPYWYQCHHKFDVTGICHVKLQPRVQSTVHCAVASQPYRNCWEYFQVVCKPNSYLIGWMPRTNSWERNKRSHEAKQSRRSN